MMLGRAGSMVADRYRLDQLTASADGFEHWRAHDERLGRPVVVRLDQVADAGGAAGAGAEGGARDEDWSPQPALARIARLNYPAVAAVYDAGMTVDSVTGPVRYAVSEAVEGRSLAQVMATGPQPWTRVADWGRQICGALAALHGIGIAHGSLGPDNVAVRDDRMVKVFDAGLAPDAVAADQPEPDEAGSGSADPGAAGPDPTSTNTDTHLLGTGPGDGGAADRTTVLPSERGSLVSVDQTSVEKTMGMTAAMKLNLAEYETKIVSKLPPGAPADMYALGALLWQAVSGEPPAAAEPRPAAGRDAAAAETVLIADPDARTAVFRPQDGADAQDEAGPDPEPLLEAGVPAGFASLLQELLDPDPARRPTAARAMPRFAALAAAARASDKTMVVPPLPTRGPAPTQLMGTQGGGSGYGYGAGYGTAPAPRDEPGPVSRRHLMIGGLILLLAAVGVGIGLLIVNLVSNSSPSQDNTPSVTPSATGPVPTITLPSGAATSASPSPSPSQSASASRQTSPSPSASPSPSESPSPSASPSSTDSPSATTTSPGNIFSSLFPPAAGGDNG